MKHLKSDKPKEPISKVKLTIICVVCALLAFGATLTVLLVTRGNLGYEEARNYADEILKTKDAVESFLDADLSTLELSEEEKTKADNFAKAADKVGQYMESLSASSALKNDSVAEKYNKAKSDFAKLKEVSEVEKSLFSLLGEEGVDDSKLEDFKSSDNEFLKKFAKEIIDYKKEAEEFVEKYQDISNIDEDAMIEDYGNFQIKGEQILDNYNDMSFRDIFGYSKDDVLGFYASIEELVSILNEKI